jgi:hypothetical protein
MHDDAWTECLACGGVHEAIALQTVGGRHNDLCPNCNEILPHRIFCGGGFSASDFENDLGVDIEDSPPPLMD